MPRKSCKSKKSFLGSSFVGDEQMTVKIGFYLKHLLKRMKGLPVFPHPIFSRSFLCEQCSGVFCTGNQKKKYLCVSIRKMALKHIINTFVIGYTLLSGGRIEHTKYITLHVVPRKHFYNIVLVILMQMVQNY